MDGKSTNESSAALDGLSGGVRTTGESRQMSLQLLGGFQLADGARECAMSAGGRRLVAYLGIHGPSDRRTIASQLWSHADTEQALANLRTTLWRLPREISPPVHVVGERVALRTGVSVDVPELRRAVAAVLAPDPLGDEWRVLGRLRVGELLPGWPQHWVVVERERLRQLRMHALETLAVRAARERCFAVAVDAALEAVAIEPLRESARRVLIEIHLAEGNVIEAVRHFEYFRALVQRELGVGPSQRLTMLINAVVTAKVPTVRSTPFP